MLFQSVKVPSAEIAKCGSMVELQTGTFSQKNIKESGFMNYPADGT
jgi:hypothetical protein